MARRVILTGPWDSTIKRLKNMEKLTQRNVNRALSFIAKDLVSKIKDTIKRGSISWDPLSPLTSSRKGHSNPLLDTLSLYNAITYSKVTPLHYAIGIPKDAKGKYDVDLNMVAMVQEFGKVIVPKNASRLAIPINLMAEQLASEVENIGDIPGLFRLKGTNVLAMKEDGGITPMFILSKSVTIPPRSYMRSTFNKEKKRIKSRIYRAQAAAVLGKLYTPRR